MHNNNATKVATLTVTVDVDVTGLSDYDAARKAEKLLSAECELMVDSLRKSISDGDVRARLRHAMTLKTIPNIG